MIVVAAPNVPHTPLVIVAACRRGMLEVMPASASVNSVRAIVQLAHALDLETTAEGIEIADVADILRDVGCDIGQGFLFGQPNSVGSALKASTGTVGKT